MSGQTGAVRKIKQKLGMRKRHPTLCPSVADMLHELQLERYAGLFTKEEITIQSLLLLNESDLEKMGVPTGPRKIVLQFIQELKMGRISYGDDDLRDEDESCLMTSTSRRKEDVWNGNNNNNNNNNHNGTVGEAHHYGAAAATGIISPPPPPPPLQSTTSFRCHFAPSHLISSHLSLMCVC